MKNSLIAEEGNKALQFCPFCNRQIYDKREIGSFLPANSSINSSGKGRFLAFRTASCDNFPRNFPEKF